ncbi:hypothetical protein EHQ12_11135 [Leptospira gomenensis]|uniref:Uncharacterized protein n=1 Tax=Leptospira gomenensis TaxID=2484974 RepID=A0A5F1YK18_9LEPT|nr:hypothetical protein [Leptospira gomenensis]TGK33377.1 hypothetical protein EHQ17_11335 [Leptospira gomenensis]TGK37328.1 hypothetical protein EHQ12_11135 [Leptospira gomenensis]TGK40517.1 hypothetical protein EHQ07_18180 [Leptospira gomenensis]TGK56439.1 hypothetical protein EHQ13_14745 [Leptospira gomenensis]
MIQLKNETITIPSKFCGPPLSGNGGFSAGSAAKKLNSLSSIVKIKAPIPLDTELRVNFDPNTYSSLVDISSGSVAVEAEPAPDFRLDLPRPVSMDAILEASGSYLGFVEHPFPSCFVCGPERNEKDGMRIFSGKIPDQPGFKHLHAAIWRPWKELSDDSGSIRKEVIWAALDCPGGFAVSVEDPQMIVLAKLSGRILAPIQAEESYRILSWEIARNRRVRTAGTAIFREKEDFCVAYSEGGWMVPGNWNSENQKKN